MLCLTWSSGENTGEARVGARLKRDSRDGRARSKDDVGVEEGRMGLSGTREDANEVEATARGTAAGRTGRWDKSRASEGGIRGILCSRCC